MELWGAEYQENNAILVKVFIKTMSFELFTHMSFDLFIGIYSMSFELFTLIYTMSFDLFSHILTLA